jgi:hypothetical protein
MIKICRSCRSTWAGGMICEDCGAALVDPYGQASRDLPEGVWKYIRLQYGARRGMIVRVLAILLGPVVAVILARRALGLSPPWSFVGIVGALAAGLATWFVLHRLAGKAVRLWVLRRGQLNRKRLARALLRRPARALRK